MTNHLHGRVIVLLAILLVATILRLYKFTSPLADWHSFRQSDTASVAREYLKQKNSLFIPKYHDLSNIQSGQDNPEGYRMVELPLVSWLVAKAYIAPLPLEIHQTYRLVQIFFSIISIVYIYKIMSLTDSAPAGLIAAAIAAIMPYYIFYSRTILPEIPAVSLSLASTYYLLKNQHRHSIWLSVATLLGCTAILLKPTVGFIIAPAIIFKLIQAKSNAERLMYICIGGLMCVPTILWRYWIQRFPAGIAVNTWLLNGNKIRFRPSFFHWIFAERIAKLILGYYGLLFLLTGLISLSPATTKRWSVTATIRQLKSKYTHKLNYQSYYYWLILGCLIYLIVFATGNVQHDYYQIIITPLIIFLSTKGFISLAQNRSLVSTITLVVTAIFALSFSWFEIRGYYNINNWAIVSAGQAVDRLTPPDARIIAPYMGDTAFLYQTNRRGWPIGFDIANKIAMGATHYVSTSYDDEARQLEQQFVVIQKTDEYILIDLTQTN